MRSSFLNLRRQGLSGMQYDTDAHNIQENGCNNPVAHYNLTLLLVVTPKECVAVSSAGVQL